MKGLLPVKGKHAWSVTVGAKGQIVIPKEAREIFGIAPGDTLRLPVNRWCVHVFDALSEKALCRNVYKEMRALSREEAAPEREAGEDS